MPVRWPAIPVRFIRAITTNVASTRPAKTHQPLRPRKNRPAANEYPPTLWMSDIHMQNRLYTPHSRSVAGARSSLYRAGLNSEWPAGAAAVAVLICSLIVVTGAPRVGGL